MKIFLGSLSIICMLAGCASSPNAPAGGTAEEKPLIVFVTGDHEYSGESTMPLLAAELEKNYNMKTVVLKAHPDQNAEEIIPGLEVLNVAGLAVYLLCWLRLPGEQSRT